MSLRETYGHFSHRELAEKIVELGGLGLHPAPIGDDHARIDPLELVRQRGAADLARALLEDMGWTTDLKPPPDKPAERQDQADS